jgi:hypothetical protein
MKEHFMYVEQSTGTVMYGEVKVKVKVKYVTEHEYYSPKVSAWCTLMKTKLSVPSFFEEPTLTGVTYLGKMENDALCHAPVGSFSVSGVPPHCPIVFMPSWTGSSLIIG